jgi:hypothetical protein
MVVRNEFEFDIRGEFRADCYFQVSIFGAASYNASVVKIYNATSSLLRFEIKNIFLYLKNPLPPTL